MGAIVFQPLYRWFLLRRPGKESQSALASMVVILFAVVLPSLWIGSAVVDEAAGLFLAFSEGDIDHGANNLNYFSRCTHNIYLV